MKPVDNSVKTKCASVAFPQIHDDRMLGLAEIRMEGAPVYQSHRFFLSYEDTSAYFQEYFED